MLVVDGVQTSPRYVRFETDTLPSSTCPEATTQTKHQFSSRRDVDTLSLHMPCILLVLTVKRRKVIESHFQLPKPSNPARLLLGSPSQPLQKAKLNNSKHACMPLTHCALDRRSTRVARARSR